MRHLRRRFVPALAFALLASPAFAGFHYRATTVTEAATGRGGMNMTVEGWIDGKSAKIEFRESNHPAMGAGQYLLTQDGGETVYLVDPKEKTYAVWDLRAMLGMAGGMMQGIGPVLKLDFSDPKVEKVADDDGGSILGFPTRHIRTRTTYSLTVKVFGMGRTNQVESEDDTWWSAKLLDPGFGVWLRADPPRTGNPQLDKLIDAQAAASRGKGFPLKKVTVQTSTDKSGKKSVTKSTMEVKELAPAAVPAATFALPAGYQKTEMALPTRPVN